MLSVDQTIDPETHVEVGNLLGLQKQTVPDTSGENQDRAEMRNTTSSHVGNNQTESVNGQDQDRQRVAQAQDDQRRVTEQRPEDSTVPPSLRRPLVQDQVVQDQSQIRADNDSEKEQVLAIVLRAKGQLEDTLERLSGELAGVRGHIQQSMLDDLAGLVRDARSELQQVVEAH